MSKSDQYYDELDNRLKSLAHATVQIETHLENGYRNSMVKFFEELQQLFDHIGENYASTVADHRISRYRPYVKSRSRR